MIRAMDVNISWLNTDRPLDQSVREFSLMESIFFPFLMIVIIEMLVS